MAKKRNQTDNMQEKRKNILNNDTSFVISEAYKTARTNLIFTLATNDKKIVIITSSNPGEGKSTSCVNLAISLADMGASVLIIDADLRKPTVGKLLDIKSKNGLSNLLGGFCNLNETVNENIRNNLDVIVSGPIPPNPAELLASNVMVKLLSVLNEHYDYILIDTPPINVVTDSQLMNAIVSGIMFVVNEGKTTHPDIAKSLRSIELAQGKVLGFLKVNCNVGARRKGYRSGYKYESYSYSYSESERE
ncbi:MAG: CpsD/CapB family tyrosine-protein kinase [Eubacterium sp.]|jgi:capsular exopolysaccharide synthesis family protein|nr:CpsD/CapB family tyrosine-protein kinase [Eubacterium sp.]